MDIRGNTDSLRNTLLDEIRALCDIENENNDILPEELVLRLADLTSRINREIAIFMDRKGNILDISIGDNKTAPLTDISMRRGTARLAGVRCVHTHPNGSGMLSSVDISSTLTLRLDIMFAIGVNEGKPSDIFAAIPYPDEEGALTKTNIYGPFKAGDSRLNMLATVVNEVERNLGNVLHSNEEEEEKAILVGIEQSGKLIDGKTEGERLLDELEELATTAGAIVLGKVLQKKQAQDPAFYIGRGKLEEITLLSQANEANLLIFDDELSGSQIRNIEEMTGLKVIDRTALILDIFAKRALSREGKLQVELAQLKYRLPRLIGLGGQLSRLGGGIGTRGPGEKKLEVDRRHIRRSITQMEDELKEVGKRRNISRQSRGDTPTIAIVGYTNAGKSTLLNKLCSADVLAENKLFATLDPTTRGLELSDGRKVLVTDTVGFIRKLPHDLIEAFKSSLEEAVVADILLHVVDSTSSEMTEHIEVVNKLLQGLGALNKPVLLLMNKIDACDKDNLERVVNQYGETFEISALTGIGFDGLISGIEKAIPKDDREMHLLVPYSEGWVLPYIYENGKLLEQEYVADGTQIKALVKEKYASKLEKFQK